MTQSNVSKLQGDTFLLDEAFGVMKGDVETLNDVAAELMQLAQAMDETGINHAKINFMEFQRRTKILSKLLNLTVKNLDGESTAAHKIHLDIFNSAQQLETEKTPTDGNQ
ncbi:hypothetical protein M3152_08385 [Sporosarcina luteola]|uniref:hypothetical protein n=1 Tax=Sporosarcina luteola TaxID=582850 RepID=UPI00203D9521|nr:hypothetical protein [Sporosarcina luteola]MCM3637737.1 hypothetical protein [Sporosarcina luteola]